MSIKVTASLNPFSNEKTEYTFDSGISVNEIIKKIDTLNAVNTGWRVLFDDEIVTDFERKPEENQHVYIKLVPEGDNKDTGNGMKAGGALLTLAGIASIALLGWTGAGGLLGASLIGAGIACFAGGIALYNYEIPDVSTNRKKQESPEQDPSIKGSRNQLRPYGIVPCLLGKRRIYADLAAKNFTWVEDGSAYLYQLFCVGQSDLTIDTSTIKIDETLLVDYSQTGDINKILSGEDPLIDIRIRQGGDTPMLYDKCVHEEQINAILKHRVDDDKDGSIIRTTPDGTTEINVDVFFLNGLGKYNDDGTIDTQSVELDILYKLADEPDSAYKRLRHNTNVSKTQIFQVALPWDILVDSDKIWQFREEWFYLSGDVFEINPSRKNAYSIKILHVEDPCPSSRVIVNDNLVTFSVTFFESEENLIISGSELKTKRYSVTKSGLDPASYTVKISRITEDSTDTKVIDDVYVGSIRATKNMPPVRSEVVPGLTLIELKIKATEKLNNVVDRLNFIAQSKLPVYSGTGTGASSWNYALSSNPASAAIYAMQGGFAQQKLTDSDIDWSPFEKLYQWCDDETHKYQCNAYITESMPISTLLSSIASTCRAEIFRMNGKVTVIQDIERESFTQLFTPRNSHDYSEDILLASVPDAMNLNIVDKESGYAENQIRIYNTPDGKYDGIPDIIQEVNLWGVTDNEQARRIGMYNYAVTNHRALIHKFSADFEYLMCQKGDWIKYAGDIALAGISQGRITAVLMNDQDQLIGFECDEALPMEIGKSYGMRVRKQDGDCTIFYLANDGTSSKTVTLQNPEAVSETMPDEGDLFTFGEVKGAKLEDAIDLIVTDIQCGENLSADLTCVEYSPEIFGVDEEGFELPDYENKISEIQGATDNGNVSDWRTWTTYYDGVNNPSKPTGDGTNDGWHYVQTSESKWISTKTAKTVNDGEWSEPSPLGQFALVKIKEIVGNGSDSIDKPDTVTGLSATASRDGIAISWNPVNSNGLQNVIKHYKIQISRNDGTNWADLVNITDSSYIYPFVRETDGYPEAASLATWRIRVRAENVYGKVSEIWTDTNVSTSYYGTWIPNAPSAVKAVAEKDFISISWQCNTSGIYGANLFRIKRNGNTLAQGLGGQSFVYYFERSKGEYPEKTDFSDDSWSFTVEVYNESGNSKNSSATYDLSKYKTWLPAIPAIGVTASSRTISVDIRADDSYWGWNRYELQLSQDNKTWFAANTSDSYDAYETEDGWKGSGTDTDVISTQFYMEMPLRDQASNAPKDTTYYVRVRAVTKTKNSTSPYADKDNISDFCTGMAVVVKASGVKDIVNSAITAEKLANSAVTAEKISADMVTARKLNVIATNLVNSIINDTAGADTVIGWLGLKPVADSTTGFVIGQCASNTKPAFYSYEFTVLPDAVYEVKFGIEVSNYSSGSGLYIGLNANQSLIQYKWNSSKKQWFYVGKGTNKYFLENYKTNGRKYFTTYILGANVGTGTGTSTNVPAQNIPAPVLTDNTYVISALQLTGTLKETFIRSGYNAMSGSPVWRIITPQVYERNSSSITAEDIKTAKLAAISANLGDVATGSVSSAVDANGNPAPDDSLLYLNGKAGSEEFYIGNVKKSAASADVDSHQFLKFSGGNLVMKIANFIVTSVASTIRGTFKVTNKASTKTDIFTVNPNDSDAEKSTATLKGSFSASGDIHVGKGKAIYADGSKANSAIMKFKDNTTDNSGNGVVIGGGGAVVIGGGESADTYYSGAKLDAGSETLAVTNDGAITFASNLQNGYANAKIMTMETNGKLTNNNGFVGNISGSSGSCTGNAATATTLQTARNINGTSFNGSAAITTAKWGTARNISISDSSGTNTGTAVSVDGNSNATLKLPATIKAALTGNCSGSSSSAIYGVAVVDTSTADTTIALEAILPGYVLTNNASILLYCRQTRRGTNNNATLNVNKTGAKTIRIQDARQSRSDPDTGFIFAGLYVANPSANYWDLTPIMLLDPTDFLSGRSWGTYGSAAATGIGVRESSFGTSYGYIKYANGLLIQWGKTTSSSGKASVSFGAYSSRESYAIFVAEGVSNCETRTTQDDTDGYDYGAGIDQKYKDSCVFSCQSNRKIFYLAIGY